LELLGSSPSAIMFLCQCFSSRRCVFLTASITFAPLSDAGRARVRQCSTSARALVLDLCWHHNASVRILLAMRHHGRQTSLPTMGDHAQINLAPCNEPLLPPCSTHNHHSILCLAPCICTLHAHLYARSRSFSSHTRALAGSVTQVCTDPLTVISLTRHARFFGCGRFRC